MSTFRTGTKPGSTYAVITVTLEMSVPSSWGPDTSLSQVYHQALDDANEVLSKALPNARIVGDIKVKSVTQALDKP
jgi:hypothetical protein